MADKPDSPDNPFFELRRQAENLLSQKPHEGSQSPLLDIERLVHELEVHQVELEMQNEELVKAQGELEESRDRYSDLYNFAPVGYVTLNEKGIILEANLTVSNMLGVERNKLVNQQFANYIFREDQDTYYFFKKRLSEAHIQSAEEVRLNCQGSKPLFALMEGITMPGKDGRLICHLSISDIAKQKAAQKELAESEERFRTMSDFTTDWEYWIAPDKEFVYISPSCEVISGYSALEFRADPELLLKIAHPDDRETWRAHETSIFHSNQPGTLDLRILTPTGRVRWIHHLCRPVYSKSGKWLGRRISNRDITERKSAEKEREKLIDQLRRAREIQKLLSARLLEEQENERRVIARELHDEVGQALTALKINLQTVQRKNNKGLELNESIDLVAQTLEQVRAISLNLPPKVLDDLGLAPALRWLLDQQGKQAGFKTAFISSLEEERLPASLEIACFRVAQEALTNIMRHSQAQNVKMILTLVDQELLLTVNDDGRGFKVEEAYARARQGSSLGLISMQERVVLAGGRMEIESTPEMGTVIHASFPLDSLNQPDGRQEKRR